MKKRFAIIVLAAAMVVGTFTGCGKGTDKKDVSNSNVNNSVAVEDMFKAVQETLGENYWPTETITGEDAAQLYSITNDNCEELMAQVPKMNTNADLLIIANAKDGKTDDVKAEMEALRDSKVNDMMQYPMNIQKIAASSVNVVGNYVIYVQLGGSAADAPSDEEIKSLSEADNKKALEVIENLVNGK